MTTTSDIFDDSRGTTTIEIMPMISLTKGAQMGATIITDRKPLANGGLGKGRKCRIRFLRVPCFDICAKNAVTVVKGSEPESFYVIPRGAALEKVAGTLGIGSEKKRGKDLGPPKSRPSPNRPLSCQ